MVAVEVSEEALRLAGMRWEDASEGCRMRNDKEGGASGKWKTPARG
jgi:hypothetical protein